MYLNHHNNPTYGTMGAAAAAPSAEKAINYLKNTEDLSEFHALAASSGWLTDRLSKLPHNRQYTLLASTNEAVTRTGTGGSLQKLKTAAANGDQAAKDQISQILDIHLVNGEMAGLNAFEAPNTDSVLQVPAYTNFGIANNETHASYKVLVMPHGESKPSTQKAVSTYAVMNEEGAATPATFATAHYPESAAAAAENYEYPNLNLVDDTNQILFGNVKVSQTAAHLPDEGNLSIVHINRLFTRSK